MVDYTSILFPAGIMAVAGAIYGVIIRLISRDEDSPNASTPTLIDAEEPLADPNPIPFRQNNTTPDRATASEETRVADSIESPIVPAPFEEETDAATEAFSSDNAANTREEVIENEALSPANEELAEAIIDTENTSNADNEHDQLAALDFEEMEEVSTDETEIVETENSLFEEIIAEDDEQRQETAEPIVAEEIILDANNEIQLPSELELFETEERTNDETEANDEALFFDEIIEIEDEQTQETVEPIAAKEIIFEENSEMHLPPELEVFETEERTNGETKAVEEEALLFDETEETIAENVEPIIEPVAAAELTTEKEPLTNAIPSIADTKLNDNAFDMDETPKNAPEEFANFEEELVLVGLPTTEEPELFSNATVSDATLDEDDQHPLLIVATAYEEPIAAPQAEEKPEASVETVLKAEPAAIVLTEEPEPETTVEPAALAEEPAKAEQTADKPTEDEPQRPTATQQAFDF